MNTNPKQDSFIQSALWSMESWLWDYDLTAGVVTRIGMKSGKQDLFIVRADELLKSIYSQDLPAVRFAWSEHITGRVDEFSCKFRVTAGEHLKWVAAVGHISSRDKAGRPLRVRGVVHNILHTHLLSRHQRIASLVIENMSEGVTVTDSQLNITFVNRAYLRMTGYCENELLGKPTSMLYSLRDTIQSYGKIDDGIIKAGTWSGARWFKRKDGSEFRGLLTVSTVFDTDNCPTHHVGIAYDLTDRDKRKEISIEQIKSDEQHHLALMERDEKLLLALWGSDDIFWNYSPETGLCWRTGVAPNGIDQGERRATWTDHIESIHPDDLPQMEKALQKAALIMHTTNRAEIFEYEFRIHLTRDSWTWLRVRGKVVEVDKNGRMLRITGWARDFTSTRSAEQNQRIAAAVIESMGESVVVLTLDFKIVSVNKAFNRLTGYGNTELYGKLVTDLLCSRIFRDFGRHLTNEFSKTGHWQSESLVSRKDGKNILVSFEISPVIDATGVHTHYVCVASDLTEVRERQREIRIAAEVLKTMDEAVVISDRKLICVSANPALLHLYDYTESEIRGQPVNIFRSSKHPEEFYSRVDAQIKNNCHWHGEMWQRRRDGTEFLGLVSCNAVRNAKGQVTHYVTVVTDITSRKRAEDELRYLANYDILTGLPNRMLLQERLNHAIALSNRNHHRLAVLYIDLDKFKLINDSAGHAAGDTVLKYVALRLKSALRDIDTVARLSGDEFTVILEEVEGTSQVEEVAVKLLNLFKKPFKIDVDPELELVVTLSIGISLCPEHSRSGETLLKFSDAAMYKAKECGRNNYKMYSRTIDMSMRRRTRIVGALRRSLTNREMSMVYQPKWSISQRRICGVEALMRWKSESVGVIPPKTFIPIAEECGMIIDLGDFALNEACAQLKKWKNNGPIDFSVAVNVSMLQLQHGDLPKRLSDVLSQYDIEPKNLELELTESMLMSNPHISLDALKAMRELGIAIAIDDFGSGYSSLSHLKMLPINTLKIDQVFVEDLTSDLGGKTIVGSIISMAHSLKLDVVAEGVENRNQFNFLKSAGCDQVQGYFLSRPLGADDCEKFIVSCLNTPPV